jgi:hypothetical protein
MESSGTYVAAKQAVSPVDRTSSCSGLSHLSPVVKYHGLARLHPRPHRLLMWPRLNGGTLARQASIGDRIEVKVRKTAPCGTFSRFSTTRRLSCR